MPDAVHRDRDKMQSVVRGPFQLNYYVIPFVSRKYGASHPGRVPRRGDLVPYIPRVAPARTALIAEDKIAAIVGNVDVKLE